MDPEVRIIGFGEAHAPAGFVGRSTARRFADDLLPILSRRAHFLLVELLVPPSGCEEARREVQDESDEITRGQAGGNQSDYVTLGQKARTLGLVPDILRPSCEQMRIISEADPPVLEMMRTIADLSIARTEEELSRAPPNRPLVLLYGGALHNDLLPRPGLESWSYGERLSKQFPDAYLEVDLVLPELLQDTESWRKFAWYGAVRSLPEGHGPVVIRIARDSRALVLVDERLPSKKKSLNEPEQQER